MNNTTKNFLRGISFAAAVAIAAGLTGCGKKKAEEAEAIFAINTFKTEKSSLDDYLEFGGDVAAVSSVDVMPDMSGKISRILVSVGDFVEKNQVIAEVDASRPGMNYSASPVKAPIAGTVTSLAPSIGTMVSPAMSMAKIAKTNELEIKTSVAERYISRIKLNQKADVTFDAYPGVNFSARVFEVSPVLDTTTRTMAIKLRIEPTDERIRVGMYARIHLVTEHVASAIVVPYASLVVRNGESFIFVVDRKDSVVDQAAAAETAESSGKKDNDIAANAPVVHLQKVTAGLHVDDRVEITDGITTGDEIVVRGQTLLNDGAKVNIISVTNGEKK
jgi:membrane fusion protein, multidrug efflux system